MALPSELVLVRHGQSEGNIAYRASKTGDNSYYTEGFRDRHSSGWRLTDKGISQAISAGEWIKSNISTHFDRYYTSSYVRAMETAAYLDLPDATWFKDFSLREADWGALEAMTDEERRARYPDVFRAKELNSFYSSSPGGESIANLAETRVEKILGTLHRECDDKKVILVSHGLVMWAFRVRLERMDDAEYIRLEGSRDPKNIIHNCQILHYTRHNPDNGELSPYLNWMRSVCPWDTRKSSNIWIPIDRKKYTNEDLLKEAGRLERLITSA